jgi:hypothetical protein
LTAFEKRRYATARRKAEQFIAWREEYLCDLRLRRNYHLQTYHKALRAILTHGLNHPMGDIWADACELHERRYQALDSEIDTFAGTPFQSLIPVFERRSA